MLRGFNSIYTMGITKLLRHYFSRVCSCVRSGVSLFHYCICQWNLTIQLQLLLYIYTHSLLTPGGWAERATITDLVIHFLKIWSGLLQARTKSVCGWYFLICPFSSDSRVSIVSRLARSVFSKCSTSYLRRLKRCLPSVARGGMWVASGVVIRSGWLEILICLRLVCIEPSCGYCKPYRCSNSFHVRSPILVIHSGLSSQAEWNVPSVCLCALK